MSRALAKDIVSDHEQLLRIIREGRSEQVIPLLWRHLNAGLARMGNLIRENYRSYFILDEEDNDYWVRYTQQLIAKTGKNTD